MTELIAVPPNVEAIFSRPGHCWNKAELEHVAEWLLRDRQYSCLLGLAAFKLCKEATLQDVEDVLGDLFANFLSIARSYDPTKENAHLFWGYLRICLSRLCYKRSRLIWKRSEIVVIRKSENANSELSEIEVVDERPGPDEILEYKEHRETLRMCLESLPAIYRTVFILREIDNLSTAEAADKLGISVSNVKVRLHRAWQLLSERFQRK